MRDVQLVCHSRDVVRDEIADLTAEEVAGTSVNSLYEISETPGIWVCATIASVIDDWCYLACKRCMSKMENKDDRVECTKCNATVGIFCYRIRFGVNDPSADATLICWDREGERIIGRPCHLLKLTQHPNSFHFPDEVSELIGKTMLFKVRIQPDKPGTYRAAFSVRVVVDESLIAKYHNWQESDFLTLMLKEDTNNGMIVQQVDSVGDTSTVKRNLREELNAEIELVVFAESAIVDKGKAKVLDE
ncbi:replication protein A 70 kDa DNA-binding subunit [Striga asiatica]|uniref:Replication protein A 70 kDa DNA-binding subunit n=1 Tax=Striga asiatica TaxID=4170 RepID=A0A5A7PX57_STRAF|nr:replication protein A 70 kDa DNA-binding subunit [Striga asiatica]